MKKGWIDYYPIIGIELYLIATLFLFVLGPYGWPMEDSMYFWGLMAVYLTALAAGYVFGRASKLCCVKRVISLGKKNRYFFCGVAGSLIFLFLEMSRNFGMETFNLPALMRKIAGAMENPTAQYLASYSSDVFKGLGGKGVTLLILLLSPVIFSVIALYFIWFRELSLFNKAAGAMVVFCQSVRFIAQGKNKGIFDIVIVLAVVYSVKLLRGKIEVKGRKKCTNKITILMIVLVIMGAFWNFGKVIDARLGGGWKGYTIGGIGITLDKPLTKIIPANFHGLLASITGYLTQGYYALLIATRMKWIPMWGSGSSKFMLEYFQKYFGADFINNSYQYRLIEYSWYPDLNWHTFYLWIANDTGLLGVGVVLLMVGFFLAKLYRETIYGKSVLSEILLIDFVILCIYIPANNQIFSFIDSFVTFFVLFGLWFFSKTNILKRRGI